MKSFPLSLMVFVLLAISACSPKTESTEKWEIFEQQFTAEFKGNPFTEVELFGIFSKGEKEIKARGFFDGNNTYKIRFMPEDTGVWHYKTVSNLPALNGKTGSFKCIEPSEGNNGPVRVSNRYSFNYSNGKPYYQVGTTAYAWIHQGDSLENI
ncbi:MAG: DUF5060 domain-containing protein, partial [Bacteroidales bacterium]